MVGEVAGGRPDLLAVDDPLVAVEDGPAAEVAEVGPGVGLRVALAPQVLAGEDAGQVVGLLLVGPPHLEGVAEHLDAEDVVEPAGRHAGLGQLLGEDHLLQRRQPRAAVLLRPAGRQVAVLVEGVAPLADEPLQLLALELADALPARREVLGEEGLDLLAVGLALGRVGGLHGPDTTHRSAAPAGPRGGREPSPTTVRRATAAAPMRGPSAPRPAGTMRAPRAKLMRARRSSSAWAAVKKTSPKPSATEPATTASPRSSSTQTSATARPTSRPVRSRTASGASAGGRPVIAAMARPDASASRQPRLPHGHGRPSGSTTRWPTCPALPSAPSSSRPSSTMPPPTPVLTTMARKFAAPPGRAAPALAEGQRLGVVVDHHRQAGQLRQPRSQGEVPPAGDVERRDELTTGRHRPAAAHADARPDGGRGALERGRHERGQTRPGVGAVGRPFGRAPARGPPSSTRPTASLVPPTSIAR